MDFLHDLLARSDLLRLFLVVAVGFLVGEIRWPGNFRLGVAAVLFVGLLVGAWDSKFALHGIVGDLGLVLFVYCVGLEVAPGFFGSLKKNGLAANLSVAFALTMAAALAAAFLAFSGRPPAMLLGAFCGAMTNTPALASLAESFANSGDQGSAAQVVVGYGIVYPFALTAVLLLMQFQLSRRNAAPSENVVRTAWVPPMIIEVRNSSSGEPFGALDIEERTGVVLSRIFEPDGSSRILADSDHLAIGARVVAVGRPEQLSAAVNILGSPAPALPDDHEYESHRYMVSRLEITGRPIRELGLARLGAVITRIRRGDVDLPVTGGTVLLPGDRVRVVSYSKAEQEVRRFFGNSLQNLSETGYLTFSLGIVIGVLLGMVPVPVPGLPSPLHLGAAAGPLIVALILGTLGRTGPFVWNLPYAANQTLKQFGLIVFLAAVGLRAGGQVMGAIREDGVFLIVMGIALAVVVHLALWLALSIRRVKDVSTSCGESAGMQTQPAVLAFVNAKADPSAVATAYTTVYPLSLIYKVVLVQVLMVIFS